MGPAAARRSMPSRSRSSITSRPGWTGSTSCWSSARERPSSSAKATSPSSSTKCPRSMCSRWGCRMSTRANRASSGTSRRASRVEADTGKSGSGMPTILPRAPRTAAPVVLAVQHCTPVRLRLRRTQYGAPRRATSNDGLRPFLFSCAPSERFHLPQRLQRSTSPEQAMRGARHLRPPCKRSSRAQPPRRAPTRKPGARQPASPSASPGGRLLAAPPATAAASWAAWAATAALPAAARARWTASSTPRRGAARGASPATAAAIGAGRRSNGPAPAATAAVAAGACGAVLSVQRRRLGFPGRRRMPPPAAGRVKRASRSECRCRPCRPGRSGPCRTRDCSRRRHERRAAVLGWVGAVARVEARRGTEPHEEPVPMLVMHSPHRRSNRPWPRSRRTPASTWARWSSCSSCSARPRAGSVGPVVELLELLELDPEVLALVPGEARGRAARARVVGAGARRARGRAARAARARAAHGLGARAAEHEHGEYGDGQAHQISSRVGTSV